MNEHDVFMIAEVGQAHDGSLGQVHAYIDALKNTGVNAVKFQTHIAEAESSEQEPFRAKFSYQDKTRFEYWKRMSFTGEQWEGIRDHCREVGVEFMSSPFSIAAVELLEELGIKRYKIGSGDTDNFLLLDRVGATGKPIILSSGMSSYKELDASVDFLSSYSSEVSILQCTTSYPTAEKEVGLNVIPELIARYPNKTIGFSDHSGTINAGISAVTLGAKILEFHVVFDKNSFGPDAKASLTPSEIKQLVQAVRFTENALRNPVNKTNNEAFTGLKEMFGRSLAVNKDLPVGSIIVKDDLECKKPAGHGVSASDFKNVIGRKLKRPLSKYDFLQVKDLADE